MRTHDASSGRERVGSRTRLAALSLLLLAAASGACATTGGGGSGNFDDRPVHVEVENQSWNAVHVYVLAGGQYQSLGQISSQNTDRFEVPRGLLGGRKEIRLAADPIGSREGFISDRILVEPGDVVSWTLTQPLAHSRVFVN
jgi:hypothetical protein